VNRELSDRGVLPSAIPGIDRGRKDVRLQGSWQQMRLKTELRGFDSYGVPTFYREWHSRRRDNWQRYNLENHQLIVPSPAMWTWQRSAERGKGPVKILAGGRAPGCTGLDCAASR
jgi:hypothetical protein